MKQSKKNWKVRVLSFGLAASCLCGGVLAAGDKDDPLISLSYLTKTVIPEILEQVDEKAEEYQRSLLEDFNKAIDQHKGEMQQEQKENAKSATYEAVVLTQGQKIVLTMGGEILLRAGSVTAAAAESPALVDMSGGSSLNAGEVLAENHLYAAVQSECVVTADSDDVTVLIRGEYQLL